MLPASGIYSFYPNLLLNLFPGTVDALNFHKSIGGVYLAFSALWIIGIFQKRYMKSALITNFLFMLGLGIGRLLSMVLDGQPSFAYQLGTIGELVLAFYGLYVLTKVQNA